MIYHMEMPPVPLLLYHLLLPVYVTDTQMAPENDHTCPPAVKALDPGYCAKPCIECARYVSVLCAGVAACAVVMGVQVCVLRRYGVEKPMIFEAFGSFWPEMKDMVPREASELNDLPEYWPMEHMSYSGVTNSHTFAKIIPGLLDKLNFEGGKDIHPIFNECIPRFDMLGFVAALSTTYYSVRRGDACAQCT